AHRAVYRVPGYLEIATGWFFNTVKTIETIYLKQQNTLEFQYIFTNKHVTGSTVLENYGKLHNVK
ncbi:hypothetical protein QOZ62_28970, partial [Pseudomonas aeruginosa]|uniref:hypothetical protein n=1 Tax=Pseudomonas aeruginosa TaxID=287 RepID=UPI00345B24C1